VDKAFDLFPISLEGKKVLLKPNVLRASEPSEGIVTNPALLRAVVERVEAGGPAEIIVGDNPGIFSYGANEEAFRVTGLMDASKGYYRNIGDEARKIDFNPAFAPSLNISQAVMEADVIISLPKFKTHGLTVVSGAIKNSQIPVLPASAARSCALKRRSPWADGSRVFSQLIFDPDCRLRHACYFRPTGMM
jgi:uncharacterized protein (DUF362 family)